MHLKIVIVGKNNVMPFNLLKGAVLLENHVYYKDTQSMSSRQTLKQLLG